MQPSGVAQYVSVMGASNNTGFDVDYAITNGCNPSPAAPDIEYLCNTLMGRNLTATYAMVQITVQTPSFHPSLTHSSGGPLLECWRGVADCGANVPVDHQHIHWH